MTKAILFYRNSLLTKLFMLVILLVGGGNSAWTQTVLFSQDFSNGSLDYSKNFSYSKTKTLTNIVGDGNNLFTSLYTGNTLNTGIAINSSTGGNSVDATGFFQAYYNNTYAGWSVARTNDFAATAPTAVMMTIDIWVNRLSGNVANGWPGIQFAIGDGFSDGSYTNPDEGVIHSAFTISAGNDNEDPSLYDFKNSNYATHTKLYSTALTQSTWLSVTWIINNTGETLTYDNPTGSGTSTVGNDKFDIWLKATADDNSTYTRVVAGQVATTTTKDLQEMYIGYPGLNRAMEFRMDNIVVTDLTPSSCTSVNAPTDLRCSNRSKTSLTFSWTAASNALSYDVTLYSDSECSYQVATANVSSTSKEFTDLTAGTTYYCKVQSKGDGSTYCIDGNVTDAISGTTASKDYTVTAVSNNDSYGTASANDSSLDEGETTTITAVAETGYKFRSWEVTGTGSTLSSDTDNPTTLTMGTVNATVTATFSALETYTITYNKGANGSGSTIANGSKTEDVGFTLSSKTYTYSGHKQMGWSTSDGGEKTYDLGGIYTVNADLALYPYWIETHTITYNSNGGTGYMVATTDAGEITLKANIYTKTGYAFLGWATSQSNADAGIVAYMDKAAYTLEADVTLYAVWAESYCDLKTVTSGTAPSVGETVRMQDGAFGGVVKVESSASTLSYVSNGFQAGYGATTLDVTLNDYLKPGSVIVVTLNTSNANYLPGYDLYTSDGTKKIDSFVMTEAVTTTFQYKIKADDNLDGTNGFKLVKTNNYTIVFKSLTVTDCQPGGVINAAGWNTYSSNKKLDLSTISGGTAYVASSSGDATVRMKTCTDIVDAAEGLMIKGEPGATFTINTTTEDDDFAGTNLLVGLPNGGSAPQGSYVFGWPTASENPAEDCGFYYANASAVTLGAGKSYLSSGGGSARLSIVFDDEQTTGIDDSKSGMMNSNQEFFDLQGRKVKNPTKGLYISNGKKAFVGNKH